MKLLYFITQQNKLFTIPYLTYIRIGNDRNPSSPYTTLSEDNLNQSDSDGGLYIEKFEKKRKFRTSLYKLFQIHFKHDIY